MNIKSFLVSYDLGGPESSSDYRALIDKIKSYHWCKPLESLWLITVEGEDCSDIRDELKNYLDSNDKLLIIDVTGSDWATRNINSKVTDWMKHNL